MIIENTKVKKTIDEFPDFKIYFLVCLFFLTGIILGTIYFRIILCEPAIEEKIIEKFLNATVNKDTISNQEIFIEVALKNIKTLIVFWIVGVSAIGSPVLVIACIYKGFSVSFTISTIIYNLGFIEGNVYAFKSIFLYMTVTVFAMILLTVSSIKLSQNVIKNKKDIRLEIIRHSILTFFTIFLFAFAVLLEVISIK